MDYLHGSTMREAYHIDFKAVSPGKITLIETLQVVISNETWTNFQ